MSISALVAACATALAAAASVPGTPSPANPPSVRVPPGEKAPEPLGNGLDVVVPPPRAAPTVPDRPAGDGVPAMSLHR